MYTDEELKTYARIISNKLDALKQAHLQSLANDKAQELFEEWKATLEIKTSRG